MKRIMLFGPPGSGKSTFAIDLSSRLQIPLHHLDKYFFVEKWNKREYSDFLRILDELVSEESWIIDGNCMRSLETRFARADTAIYFRFPLHMCLWRILIRRFQTHRPIDDRAEGCDEAIHWNLIWYLIRYKRKYKNMIASLHKKYPHVNLLIFTTDEEAQEFLRLHPV
jgi:adenylate kinase family enzyme